MEQNGGDEGGISGERLNSALSSMGSEWQYRGSETVCGPRIGEKDLMWTFLGRPRFRFAKESWLLLEMTVDPDVGCICTTLHGDLNGNRRQNPVFFIARWPLSKNCGLCDKASWQAFFQLIPPRFPTLNVCQCFPIKSKICSKKIINNFNLKNNCVYGMPSCCRI